MMHLGIKIILDTVSLFLLFNSRFTVHHCFFSKVEGMLQNNVWNIMDLYRCFQKLEAAACLNVETQDDHQWAGNCQTLVRRVRWGSQFLGAFGWGSDNPNSVGIGNRTGMNKYQLHQCKRVEWMCLPKKVRDRSPPDGAVDVWFSIWSLMAC